ncbi:MAG: heme exporter protein CcmB [Actinomycetota bacterium]
MIGAALAIARVKLLLELRRREVVFAMLLFVIATIVIVHFALRADAGAGPRAAAGMLWAAVDFTAVLGLLRAFAAEAEEGALDALLLAPVDRAAIWLGSALAQFGFLVVVELVAVPLWWLLFFQEDGPAPVPVIAALLLANVGIALVGTLAAALALGARTRDVLLPVLVLPLAIPLVLAGVTATYGAFGEEGGGFGPLGPLGFLALYDLIFLALAWGTSEHLLGD